MQIYSEYVFQHAYLSLLHFVCTEGKVMAWKSVKGPTFNAQKYF